MFDKTLFYTFRVGAKLQFFVNVLAHCNRHDLATLLILSDVEALSITIDECQATFKTMSKSQLTALIKLYDDKRDQLIRCLTLLCKGYALHFDEAIVEAANRFLDEIEKYGKEIYNLSYIEETPVVANLCSDLLEGEQGSLDTETLGLAAIVEKLKADNIQFSAYFEDRQ